MTDLETLQALLDAAGLEKDCYCFQQGGLAWQSETLDDPSIVLDRLKSAIETDASGWILFADRIAEANGTWNSEWQNDYPLEAELALTDHGSLRITHLKGEWIVTRSMVVQDANVILETTTHRKLHGGTVVHQVAWTGDPLRPNSAALQSIHNS